MSLLPYVLSDIYNDTLFRPSRILDQQFGLGLLPEDILEPLAAPSLRFQHYFRPWRSALSKLDQGSTVQADKDKFQISLDVQQFSPNEITVKTVGDSIIVEGKHEEKKDEHGYISRQFTRRYVLPPGHDIQNVASSLSSDGVLTVTAPKVAIEGDSNEKNIPITQTGPVKAVKDKEAEKK